MSASTGALAENAHSELHTKGGDTQVVIAALPKDSVPIGAVGISHTMKVVDGARESTGIFTERTTAELHIKSGAVQVTASTGAELRVKAGAVQANVELRHGRIATLTLMGHVAPVIAGKFLGLSPSLDLMFSDIPDAVPAAGWVQIFAYVGFSELISPPTVLPAGRHMWHTCA